MKTLRLTAGVLCCLVGATCCAQTLRLEADKDGLLVGTAVRWAQLSEPAYASTLAHEFNMLEPEDAMKWAALEFRWRLLWQRYRRPPRS